ncbi:hypothetical protein HK405_008667 [Cladochytrium tenue]|nr:hypothetical protein HK405_008667 [Cladochytrium tenue]
MDATSGANSAPLAGNTLPLVPKASPPSALPTRPLPITPLAAASQYVDDNVRARQQIPVPLAPVEGSLGQMHHTHSQWGPTPGATPMAAAVSGIRAVMDDPRVQAMNKRVTHAFGGWGKKRGPELRTPDSKAVFGAPLEQALAVSRISDSMEIPAVVYPTEEEGIYRLSGQSTVIQQLRERFNAEYDVDLLSGEAYDVHAVAGVLKLYFRELPSPILTPSLQRYFLAVQEIESRDDRVTELTRLVSLLPSANYTLLRVLLSHLVDVVRMSDVNKMTVRNIGIVFSPTLNIPSSVFTLLLAEFNTTFCWEDPVRAAEAKDRILDLAERVRAAASAAAAASSPTPPAFSVGPSDAVAAQSTDAGPTNFGSSTSYYPTSGGSPMPQTVEDRAPSRGPMMARTSNDVPVVPPKGDAQLEKHVLLNSPDS